MVERKGRDYNEHVLSYINWSYIYTNAHHYSKLNLCKRIHEYVNQLNELIEVSNESLKNCMYYVFLKTIKNKVVKDCGNDVNDEYELIDIYFSEFDLNELKAAYKLYKIMTKEVFYPWHFYCRPLGYLLLKNLNSNRFYINPYPHIFSKNNFFWLLSSISQSKFEGSVDKENYDIYKNFDFSISVDVYGKNFEFNKDLKNAEIEFRSFELIKKIFDNSSINSLDFVKYNELMSKINNIRSDSSSNFSRSVGLYLWEKIYFSKDKYNRENVLDWFYKTQIYYKLNKKIKDRKNEYLGDKDKKTLIKWLDNTSKCINSNDVLPFT